MKLPGRLTVFFDKRNPVPIKIEGPYALAVSPALWKVISSRFSGYPAMRHLQELIGGPILFSKVLSDALLISQRRGDLQLVIGQDYSVGYYSHDSESVRLFLTESFTFRIIEPKAVIRMRVKK